MDDQGRPKIPRGGLEWLVSRVEVTGPLSMEPRLSAVDDEAFKNYLRNVGRGDTVRGATEIDEKDSGEVLPQRAFGHDPSQEREHYTRKPMAEVSALLFKAFEQKANWKKLDLYHYIQSPMDSIQEVLAQVAVPVKTGPMRGTWVLNDDSKPQKDGDDDDDMMMMDIGANE